MSDYIKSTNFASKDSLASGNPLKIVKGTEIDTEFNNIATAVATKADILSPALTGIPTAPTAAAGTNTTQIATTAFVTTGLQAAFPIGSIYMNASSSTNPATLFGFGTWVVFGEGRMPVGYKSGDALFGTAGNTGGSRDAVVVSHNHTITDPGHTHTGVGYNQGLGYSGYPGFTGSGDALTTAASNSSTTGITVNSAGVSGTNANLPPYITVYMWQRTA